MVVDKVFQVTRNPDVRATYIIRTKSKKYFKFTSIYDLLYPGIKISLRKLNGGYDRSTYLFIKYRHGYQFRNQEKLVLQQLIEEEVMNQVLLNT